MSLLSRPLVLLRALLFESSSRRSPRVTRRRSLGLRYHLNRTILIMRNRSVQYKGRLNFDPERVKDLGCTPEDQNVIFDPSHTSDVPKKETSTAVKQRSHPMHLGSAKIQEISLNEISIGSLLQNYSVIQWLSH